jgi:hypothetical protein
MTDPTRWNINWSSLTTPGDLLTLLLTQLSPQVELAIKAGRSLLTTDDERVANTTLFLASASSAASFLWPSPSRRRPIAEAFPNRADDLRHILGLLDAQPTALVRIRNDLTHVDERIEELFLANPDLSIVTWSSATTAAAGTHIYMAFDRDTETLHSLGQEVQVRELVEWLEGLLARISRTWLAVMVRSTGIGA